MSESPGRWLRGVLVPAMALLGLVAAGATPARPDSSAVDLWRQRSRGFEIGQLDPEPTRELIARLEVNLERRPSDLQTRFRLLEALYYQGYFLTDDDAASRRIYERMVREAETTVALAEACESCEGSRSAGWSTTGCRGSANAHFWSAISWGLWGMSHNRLQAGVRGVAAKIRDHAQAVVDLDSECADGGGLRLLGRLHTATPKIPLFTGWIDRDLGISLLERAYRVSSADPRNALFLAEALLRFRPEGTERALELLREVARRQPDREWLVEETDTITAARGLLAERTNHGEDGP